VTSVLLPTYKKESSLGLADIHTLDDLARVKATVVRSIREDGWAVLNAEDDHCLKIAGRFEYATSPDFSLDENHPRAVQLAKEGKVVAVYENGFIRIKKRRTENSC